MWRFAKFLVHLLFWLGVWGVVFDVVKPPDMVPIKYIFGFLFSYLTYQGRSY